MLIATTTVASSREAEHLAAACIEQNLAVCAQVEGPIHSHYVWQGRRTVAQALPRPEDAGRKGVDRTEVDSAEIRTPRLLLSTTLMATSTH